MDENLMKAYLETDYVVFYKDSKIIIKIDQNNGFLDQLLNDNNATSCIFITAYNPQSELFSAEKNQKNQDLLIKDLSNYKFFYGEGCSVDNTWLPEKSLLVLDISIDETKKLMRKYNQKAVVIYSIFDKAKLFFSKKGSITILKYKLFVNF